MNIKITLSEDEVKNLLRNHVASVFPYTPVFEKMELSRYYNDWVVSYDDKAEAAVPELSEELQVKVND